jgi:prefoldin subunit 5
MCDSGGIDSSSNVSSRHSSRNPSLDFSSTELSALSDLAASNVIINLDKDKSKAAKAAATQPLKTPAKSLLNNPAPNTARSVRSAVINVPSGAQSARSRIPQAQIKKPGPNNAANKAVDSKAKLQASESQLAKSKPSARVSSLIINLDDEHCPSEGLISMSVPSSPRAESNHFNDDMYSMLEEQINMLNTRLEAKEGELSSTAAQIAELKSRSVCIDPGHDSLLTRVKAAEESIGTLQTQQDVERKAYADIEADLRLQLAELTEKFANRPDVEKQFNEEIAALKTKVAELNKQLENKAQELTELAAKAQSETQQFSQYNPASSSSFDRSSRQNNYAYPAPKGSKEYQLQQQLQDLQFQVFYGDSAKDKELAGAKKALAALHNQHHDLNTLQHQMQQIQFKAVESWLFAGDLSQTL